MTASSKEAIAERLAEARERTLELIEPLDDEQLNRVYSPILSPLAWDLGHIANFEELWLVQTIGGREPLHGELGRFYDAIENPRKTRGELPILRDAELRAYLADVRERTLEVLDEVEIGADAEDPLLREGFVYEMLLAHEQQHNETMLQLLQMVDGYEPVAVDPALAGRAASPTGPETVAVEAGEYEIGAPARGFAYDNERPRHAVELAAFEIDRTPVTNGAYAAFMEETGAEPPMYWERDGEGGWVRTAMGRRDPIDPGASRHPRLLARGRRLRPLGRQAAADRAGVGGGPRRSSRASATAWEWTSSRLPRLPRLRGLPLPASTPRSSSATSYKVLRGGSWATHPQRRSGPASATGTCPSAARSSPASAARGTPDDAIAIDRGPPRRRRGGDDGARRPRAASRPSRRSWRRSTSTTSAARSSSSRSPSCPSTTRPGPSARSSPSARPRSSPPPGAPSTLVELGSGSAAKTRHLLDAMRDAGCLETYVPVDISEEITHETAEPLVDEYPGLDVRGLVCDFEHHLERIPDGDGGRLIAFLGGTIGNLYPDAAPRLPRAGSRRCSAPATASCSAPTWSRTPARLEAAYDDAAGVTAEFNKNVLAVLNRELGADFDLDAFEHVARYDAERGADGHPPALARRPGGPARRPRPRRSTSPPARRCGPRSPPSSPASGWRRSTRDAGLELSGWFTDPAGDYALSLARRPPRAPAPRSARRACRAS